MLFKDRHSHPAQSQLKGSIHLLHSCKSDVNELAGAEYCKMTLMVLRLQGMSKRRGDHFHLFLWGQKKKELMHLIIILKVTEVKYLSKCFAVKVNLWNYHPRKVIEYFLVRFARKT